MKKLVRAGLMAVLLCVAPTTPALAGPLEDDASGDYATALRLLKPLAEQGLADAQFNLGVMYATGRGVPQDDVRAHMWYNLAAAGFPAAEAEPRNVVVAVRDAVAAKMTPAQIAEAQRLAREWKPKKDGQ